MRAALASATIMRTMTDPDLQAWRDAHADLGSRLVDLEAHADVALARQAPLTGVTAAAWSAAESGLYEAWETYRVLDEVLDAAEAEPDRAAERLREARVPGAGGRPTDPGTALEGARRAVEEARGVAVRLADAWDRLATRLGAARSAAAEAGDVETERSAGALADLLATDPFAVQEDDVAAIEQRAEAAAQRYRSAASSTARLEVDLVRARDTLAALEADLDGAAEELAHAASRVAGIDPRPPVPDLDALRSWLDRIEAEAATDRRRAATQLAAWREAAASRRAELDAVLGPAREALERRKRAQGLWTALRAKAGARRLDEQPEVVAALDAAQELLWTAPCDLEASEAALARLSAVLNTRPKEDR
ncbi:MAG: hypothetical protein C0P77_007520 [Thermoanaerobacterales bacterium]